MTNKQVRKEKLLKVGRGLLCFFTPHALNGLLTVLYADTLASQVLALYLVTALLIVWVLLRPSYLVVSGTLFWCAFFFLIAPFGLETHSPATVTFEEAKFYSIWYLLLCQSSAISGGLFLIGGFIYNGWKRRMRP